MADPHPFLRHPHRTMVRLSLPVLVALIAEPLTGVVDTAFVARLGTDAVAALGVATSMLTGTFWIFGFLAIGTQTEVAHALGAGERVRARDVTALALAVSLIVGVALAVLALPWLDGATRVMGAGEAIRPPAVVYLRIRLLGAAAVLLMAAAFGALRGVQDMRTPLWIALGVNALNVVLAVVLIFGWGPVPPLGVAGAGWATTISQVLGALAALESVRRQLGLTVHVPWAQLPRLLRVGRDLFLRSGALILFVLLATRAATQMGAEAGAAHQVTRQVWILTAMLLDAYAATAQSLIGYFLGAAQVSVARRVARVACLWGVGSGIVLTVSMLATEGAIATLLVPAAAYGLFASTWLIAAAAQPLNALAFVTDGIHWGTGDYRYLRNGMLIATVLAALGLAAIDRNGPHALTYVWLVTAAWIAIRAAFGVVRIWPGVGNAPLRGG